MVSKTRIVSWIPASTADTSGINRIDIKPLLANALSAFLSMANQFLIMTQEVLPGNQPDCINSNSSLFDKFILAGKFLAKP